MSSTSEPERRSYDQTLKRMLSQAPNGLVALYDPRLAVTAEPPVELHSSQRQADLVWEVRRDDGSSGILHIELQAYADARMGERLTEYGLRLWLRERKPVRSLVILLRPSAQVPASPFVVPWMGDESMRYTYETIRLWTVPQERVLDTNAYALWPLASVMAGASEATTEAVAERIVAAPLPQPERSELLSMLVVLAGLRLPRAGLLDALRRNPMIDDIFRASSVSEIFLEEGEAKGRLAATRRLARVALEGRFGALPEDVLVGIEAAQEDALVAVVAHVTTDSLDEARARLGLAEGQ